MAVHFIRTMLGYMGRFKLWCGVFLISIVCEVAYAVAAPLSLQFLVDDAFMPKDFRMFILILGILGAGGLLSIVASIFGDYSIGKLSGEVVRKLRTDLFVHLQKQSLPFYQRYRIGDLVTRFNGDMASMERVVRGSTPFFLKESLSVLLGLSMLLLIEWKLTLAMLAGSTLMFVGPRLLQGRAESDNLRYKEAQERFSNTVDEMVKGHRTIKGLHQHQRFRERADKQIHELFAFGLKLHFTNSWLERLPVTALLILNGTMIGFGGYLIFHDQLTVGGFMAFFVLFMSFGQSVSNLSFLIPSLIESSISFRRVGELLNHPPAVPEALRPLALPAAIPSVVLDQVTFGYTADSAQLRDVSLQIKAGDYAAFVGPSGSGKSTAMQLVSRFYDPREGTVAINGRDLRDVSEASLRKLCTMVSQDTFLFNATIRDNLMLDSGDLTEADMVEAAKQAGIHEAISYWPEGYDTMIQQEGGSLSGGERQRLSIARALLRRPKLLLLDEVTSALDPAAEADINQLIQDIRPNRTIISVTHRLASVVNADRIYVFRDGQVAETGTHLELLRKGGLYSVLWEKQHGFQLSQDGLHAKVEIDRLAKLPFFAGIELPLLQGIADLFSTEVCQQGDIVVKEGEEGHKFYIIVRGRFEILKEDAEEGERRVAVLEDGDHFGEIALLRGIPRTATVRAVGPAVLLSVRREAFRQLTDDYPHILTVLERSLEQRM